MLLTASDLGAGWTAGGIHTTKSTATAKKPSSLPTCVQAIRTAVDGLSSLTATYVNESARAQAEESLTNTSSPSAAAGQASQITSALSSCKPATTGTTDAGTLSVSPLTLTLPVATSNAYTMSIGSGAAAHRTDLVIGHKGAVLWVVATLGSSTLGPTTLNQMATKAAAKITG